MEKVKVGIIGLGSWGSCHLEAYSTMPQVEVVALCDMNGERVRSLADRFGVPYAYTDSAEMLARSDIQVVNIATFENNHFEPAVRALDSGKHVLVEKPVSTKLSEAAGMLEAAERNGKFIFPGHLLRFEPRYAEIYQAIQSGRIGTPHSMFFKRGRTKAMFTTYKRTHTVYELTVHDMDLAIWYAGSRVKKVRAYGKKVNDTVVPDILWTSLEFENGIIATFHSNWMTPDEAGIVMNDAVEIIGANGTAQFENSGSNLQLWDATGRKSPDYFIHQAFQASSTGALRDQLSYMCSCVASGTAPTYTSFADAVHGIEVAEAIIKAFDSGEEIILYIIAKAALHRWRAAFCALFVVGMFKNENENENERLTAIAPLESGGPNGRRLGGVGWSFFSSFPHLPVSHPRADLILNTRSGSSFTAFSPYAAFRLLTVPPVRNAPSSA